MTYIPELSAVTTSIGNSSNVSLSAGQIFVGQTEDVSQFAEISVSIYASPNNAKGIAYFEFSPNGVNWDSITPLVVSDPELFTTFPLRIILPYFRVRYVNGDVAQTTFRLTCVFHTRTSKQISRAASYVMGPSEPLQIVRAVVDPGYLSRFRLLGGDGSLYGAGITSNRLSQIYTRFNDPLNKSNITQSITGSGNITQQHSQLILSTGTSSTASAKVNSNKRMIYYPGREAHVLFTARFSNGVVNSKQLIGMFDEFNGFLIGYVGTEFGLLVRNDGIDTFIPRSDWNEDTLSGSFPSLFTRGRVPEEINFQNINIYRIRFGWLGSAPAIFEVMSPEGGWVIFHVLKFSNSGTDPSILNPDLPITAEVIKVGGGSENISLFCGSWDAGTAISEFGLAPSEYGNRTPFNANVAGAVVSSLVRTTTTNRIGQVINFVLTCVNTSTTIGQLNIRDGPSGTILLPITVPAKSGFQDGYISLGNVLQEPLNFLTSIYAEVAGGSLVYSLTMIGYEN